jgi:predicted nuclease of restriction endonuclease-like (RecB) superfamily
MNDSLPAHNGLYASIREILNQARRQIQTAVNQTMVLAYWEIGRLIVEDEQQGQSRATYGKHVLQTLSQHLTADFGKGFTVRNLEQMRKFYLLFPKTHAMRAELSWTHYRLLIRVESEQARNWYMNEAVSQHWSSRQLERQIGVLYYERLLSSQNKQAVQQEAESNLTPLTPSPRDFLRDPYILDFLNLSSQSEWYEKDLEQGLLDQLEQFLLELGKGFAFVARQQRVHTETADFRLDLVFYNYILKCFVLIDLKIGPLGHQDIGQMDMYVRMYEELFKQPGDNPTIGLILCSQKDETIVKYSVLKDSEQLFASRYLLYLPSEAELQAELERDRALFEQRQSLESP